MPALRGLFGFPVAARGCAIPLTGARHHPAEAVLVAGAAECIENARRPRIHAVRPPALGPPMQSSRARSAAGAEWVRAPMEIRETPLSA